MAMLYQLSYNGTTPLPARDLFWLRTGRPGGGEGGFLAEASQSSRPRGGPSLYHQLGSLFDGGLWLSLAQEPVCASRLRVWSGDLFSAGNGVGKSPCGGAMLQRFEYVIDK